MQRVIEQDSDEYRVVTRRLPHVLPDGAQGGYAACSECGLICYVGQPRVGSALAEFVAPREVWEREGYRW